MKEERVGQLILAGIGLLGILIVGGLVWAVIAVPSVDTGSTGTVEMGLSFNDVGDPALGPGDAKVIVREFGDFQCPSCKVAQDGIEHAVKTYGDKVRFVWNDFPLSSVHKNARPAAIAARCAEEQGKFWEYHDKLYAGQSVWSDMDAPTEMFLGYAKDLGLNTDSFGACYAAQEPLRKIQDDEAEGQVNRVQGTPTFFIGQKRFVGALTNDVWDKELKAALGS